ncbi:unnamed protein product [Brassica rapa]|uniref:Uncharacterized protein n=1 Tax=Brassica campestris TaxID=3711 RepID=A0A8D9CQW0_BRACM|nr:unnamed protein product [Brassica rapa]
MQPDIWEEWWRPACILDMHPAMWSTRCRRACVRSHAERHTGCHQPEADWLLSSEDRYSTEKASSVQSAILYDCDAKALSNSIRPSQSYSPTIKWRCCPRLVQFHGFRSVEVLLDTPPKCPKNCPAAKGDSVQISLSRRVSFFMMKPRLCPSQDQSSPVQSRRPLGFGQVLSDQPAASRLEHCELVTHPTPLSFLQVALGKDDRIAWSWTLGPPV